MSNFFSLIQNENMKIYRRSGTKVMLIILLGLLLVGALITKLNTPEPKADSQWKQHLAQENQGMQQNLNQMKGNDAYANYLKSEIAINQYRIDHNLEPAQGTTLWSFVEDSTSIMILVISIFTIIVVSTSIASEFNTGTIKLLLIRPIYRTEILLSKYIAALLFALLSLVVLFLFSWLIGGIFFGFGGADEVHLSYIGGEVQETSWTLAIWKEYLLHGASLCMMVTLAGVIASLFRNGGLSIGLTIFLLMGSNTILTLISKYEWVKYVLFANLDLTQYDNGTQLREDMSLGFSLGVLAVYYVIFVICGWLFFTKRDVKA
ncbi:ABC transporter permease [Sporolactobacillus sp. THM7-7]|nr:ABC transporter permease [Sporolactobacillus sp. THM7-7]